MKNIKFYGSLIFFLAFSFCAYCQTTTDVEQYLGIEFRNSSLDAAKRIASEKHKLIFLEAYTIWSGPCKIMEKTVFNQEQVGTFFNENFICIRKDVEKGDGVQLSKTYDIKSHPTFLFLDGKGVVKFRSKGFMSVEEFMSLGTKALDPSMHIDYLRVNAVENPYNAEFIYKYLSNCYEPGFLIDSIIITTYIDHLTDSDLTSIEAVNILAEYGVVSKDQSLSLLKLKYDELCEQFSIDTIDALYKDYIERNLNEALKNSDKLKYPKIRAALFETLAENMPDEEVWWDDFNYAIRCKNKNEMLRLINEGVTYFFKDDISQLNNLAWQIMESTDELVLLNKADELVKRSIQLGEDNINLDTRAAILHKLGRNPEAKKLAEKAISLGRKNHEDIEETQALLEEIKLELRNAK